MTASCAVVALLRPGGPVRVPLRECCVAALVGADGVVARCPAAGQPASVPPIGRPVPGEPVYREPIEVSP